MSAGFRHTCGVKANGSVECWGSDYDGESTPPVAPDPKTPVSSTDLGSLNGGPYWNRVEPHLAVAGSGGVAAPAGGDAGVSRGLVQ